MKRKKQKPASKAKARNSSEWFNFCRENYKETGEPSSKNAGIEFSNKDNGSVEIIIFGDITRYAWEEYGETDAPMIYQKLKADENADVTVRINSGGGSVFEGVAIYNLLKEHKGKVTTRIEGQAGSIASLIALAADEVYMSETSSFFIHNAWTVFAGNADQMEAMAGELRKLSGQIAGVYDRKISSSLEEINQWMKDEARFTGAECKELGFCDALYEAETEAPDEKPSAKTEKPVNAITDEQMKASMDIFKNLTEVI